MWMVWNKHTVIFPVLCLVLPKTWRVLSWVPQRGPREAQRCLLGRPRPFPGGRALLSLLRGLQPSSAVLFSHRNGRQKSSLPLCTFINDTRAGPWRLPRQGR